MGIMQKSKRGPDHPMSSAEEKKRNAIEKKKQV